MPAAVVPHGSANGVRHRREVLDKGLDRLGFEGRIAGDGLVEVGDVGLVMLAVVNLHRLSVDVRFQGFLRVGEWGQLMWHKL